MEWDNDKEGNIIEWVYTCDLGRDLGQDWLKNREINDIIY